MSPSRSNASASLEELGVRRLRLLDPQRAVRLEHAVALVAEQPAQPQARLALDVRAELDRLRDGADARAVQPDVDLDQHADLASPRVGGVGELVGVAGALDRDDHGARARRSGRARRP